MTWALLLIVAASVYSGVLSLKPASEYFPICHKTNPNLAQCIQKSIETLRPKLVKGIPELNLVPLDPLFVPKLEMRDGQGNFKFRQTLTNLNIYGLRNFEIKNLTVDMDKNLITIKCFTKTIDFDGDYDMAGRMMVIDLKGRGRALFNFTDVTTTARMESEVVSRDGVEYNRVKSLRWRIEPENAKFHFTNLFNGDKTLDIAAEPRPGPTNAPDPAPAQAPGENQRGDATNSFLNQNWKEAFRIYRSLPEEAFGTLIKDLANRVYTLFPRDELYPE